MASFPAVFSFDAAHQRIASDLLSVVEEALPLIAGDLELAGDRSTDAAVRSELYTAATTLRMQARGRALNVRHHFDQRVRDCRAQWQATSQTNTPLPRVLQLEDDEDLDAQLMSAELAQQVRSLAQAEHVNLGGRVATLLDLPALSRSQDDWQPLGARNLAACAVSALKGLLTRPVSVTALRQAVMRRFPVGLSRALEDVDTWLDGQSVGIRQASNEPLPEPEAAPSVAPGLAQVDESLVVRAAGARDTERVVAKLQASGPEVKSPDARLQTAARSAQVLGREPLARAGDGVMQAVRVVPLLAPVAELDQDAVAFAHGKGVDAYSRAARQAWFDEARQRVLEAAAPPAQLAMLDVVAAMFDYVVDETRVAPSCKSLFWRLQHPVSTLALLDSGFMGDAPRSLRRLIENLAAIATAFADELTRDSALFKRLETVVRAVEIVASALHTRSGVMAKQIDHEYVRATQGVTQLLDRVVYERNTLESTPGRRNRRDSARRPSREREAQVGEQLKALLEEKTGQREIPESVREFINNVWLRHMRTAALRDGEDSAEFRLATQVLDDLLWSIDGHGERQSRRVLAQRIPNLLKLLTSGIRASGAKDDEYRAFMDELFLMHLRKMQKREADTTGVVLPEGLLGPSPGKVTSTTSAGMPSVPLLEEAVQLPDTRPAGAAIFDALPSLEMDSKPTAGLSPVQSETEPERKLLEVLSSLSLDDLPESVEFEPAGAIDAASSVLRGRWLQLTSHDGQLSFAKVAWVNHRRTVALLMRHPDRKALSMRMDDLAQRLQQGRARVVR